MIGPGREGFLRCYGFDLERWIKRYGIEPFVAECYTCKKERRPTIPIAYGRLRGLLAPVCSCGNVDAPYCIVSVDDDLLQER